MPKVRIGMNVGKPIIEARTYQEEREGLLGRKEEGNWCGYLTERSRGYICLRSPIREVYEEPCTKEDSINCPLLKEIKGLGREEGEE